MRVALTQANPPWNFVDSKAKPIGYDVDVARELAERQGVREVQFIPHGVIVEQAEPAVFFNRPNSPRARSFLRLVEDGPLGDPLPNSRDAEEHV